MNKIEALRKTPQKAIETVKKLRPRHLLWPLAGITVAGGVWGVVDLASANDQLSNYPKYATADGRNSLAKDLFNAGKDLKGISSTTETKLGKNTDGEPVIIYQRTFSSSNWEKARQIIAEATGDLKDQPAIAEALQEIDMEIMSGGSGTADVFAQQIDRINSIIPQLAVLKDSPQAQERGVKVSEVSKKRGRDLGIVGASLFTAAFCVIVSNILNEREKRRKEASKVKQSA